MLQVVSSTSAAARLSAVVAFLESHPPSTEIVIVGATRGAADDVARAVGRRRGATFGLTRFSLTELAARAAVASLAGERRSPGSQASTEAIAARVVFDAVQSGELAYFAPVGTLPGFPRALARTVHELRLAATSGARVGEAGAAGSDLRALLDRFETELGRAGVDDRAALFRLAAGAWPAAANRWKGLPVVLLDVPIDSRVEQDFVTAILRASAAAIAVMPDGDARAMLALSALDPAVEQRPDDAEPSSDLAHLRRYLFTNEAPPRRERTGGVQLFSAPGEGREAVEIVRRILDEAERGVPFDEMAVLLRTPAQYLGLLEHAGARGGVPMYFERGTRRPDPAGRAFIALLSCGVEGLSAKRFDEYLSLGQVPRLGAGTRGGEPFVGPRDEALAVSTGDPSGDDPESAAAPFHGTDSDEDAIVSGTLRSPWKWEELIVESAVVGGHTLAEGKARWRRRLDGLAADYQFRIEELTRDEPDSPRIARLRRDLRNLAHLRTFALPIVDAVADWPDRALWGDWLGHFSSLAAQALSRPQRVLQVLADLRPMARVGPIALEEARDVLHGRLVTLDWDPPATRYGRVFVGTPHQARGRQFQVVFVPGLAERIVPQRPREDPLLLDDARRAIDAGLLRQDDRAGAERLLLKIAIGAAADRLYLSYPRMDVAETRARVPSFYALDVVRAITGQVPDHRALAAGAAAEAGASLAWPAPHDPGRAIDDLEHDLSVLKPLLDSRDPASVRGRAHYLLGLNGALNRSVKSLWRRSHAKWSSSDGLVATSPGARTAIAAHRLHAREYSLSALQRFSVCPYQFLLATIHRLQPWDEPEPLMRMDPLTRGSLFHSAQAQFYRAMQAKGALPITESGVADAVAVLDRILDEVGGEYAEKLAPAIPRVWQDEIGEIRRDLGIWVKKLVEETTWIPKYFEFSFGLHDAGRDPRSLEHPITVGGRFRLRGSVDLIEQRGEHGPLRITDHKTGKNRSNPDLIVGGGATLQPVLYSVAIEEGLGQKVEEGRLFYCTTAGGFGAKSIPITDYTRDQGLQVLTIVDRAVEEGFLVAAPSERACTWCDFRPVCGPREEERVKEKAADRLADLAALRSMR